MPRGCAATARDIRFPTASTQLQHSSMAYQDSLARWLWKATASSKVGCPWAGAGLVSSAAALLDLMRLVQPYCKADGCP